MYGTHDKAIEGSFITYYNVVRSRKSLHSSRRELDKRNHLENCAIILMADHLCVQINFIRSGELAC